LWLSTIYKIIFLLHRRLIRYVETLPGLGKVVIFAFYVLHMSLENARAEDSDYVNVSDVQVEFLEGTLGIYLECHQHHV
jgi:hypothetical protein